MDQLTVLQMRTDRYKAILRILAYPRRGTSEETHFVSAADCAQLIQSNFTLDELNNSEFDGKETQ